MLAWPAFWGISGALIFAGPTLGTCMFSSSQIGGQWVRCSFEFLTALMVGTLAAAAFTPVALELMGRDNGGWMRAISTTIGLLANRVAPRVVSIAPDAIFDWASRLLKKAEP